MSKVTIITSVYNGGKHIWGFLENIVRQTIFNECELFLLDANSPDNEYEVITSCKESIELKLEEIDLNFNEILSMYFD